MYTEVHANRVFYKSEPKPGHRYRQLVVVEKEKYELRILEGEVKDVAPVFDVNSLDAEITLHNDLRSALSDLEAQCAEAVKQGWIPYRF